MEKIRGGIYRKIAVMKKILGIAASLVLVIVSANAQSERKEPPPPPPKPKDEMVKLTPPIIVKDGEVQVKAPPPPPPKIIAHEVVNVTKPQEPPVVKIKCEIADEFYKWNLSVSDISRQGNIITLKKKDGTIEKYDMTKKEEDKSFAEKYGVSPIPPPPPPKPRSKA
jgi:hypothetical protein